MKRIIIIVVALWLGFIGCKETKKENPVPVETTAPIEEMDYDGHANTIQKMDNSWMDEIILNNGIKWQANKETTDGVTAMLSQINENRIATLEGYKVLGDGLNEIKNMVVKECTMQEASHDNLHVWLHPLIEKIEMLQNTKNIEEGVYLTSNIKKHLEGYYDYFD